ncbi:MAG TPA: type II CAAX endopeptidase family protein [Terriglobales bacterium]|nr:type II CAAX endopeptidase family protein [Terriglobales bacterium]
MSSTYNPPPELPHDVGPEHEPVQAALPGALKRAADENPAWNGWDVLRIAVVALATLSLFGAAALAVASRVTSHWKSLGDLTRDALVLIPAQLLSYAIVFAFMYVVVTRVYHRPFWAAVRWNQPKKSWLGFVGIGIALAIFVPVISSHLPVPKSLPIDQMFQTATDAYVMMIFGVAVAPLMEELFFRGFLYPVLVRRLGAVAAVILTAALFALIHSSQLGRSWSALLVIFIVGLVLTVTRALRKSVGASWLVHMAYNGTLSLLLFIGTDHFRHMDRLAQ